MKIRKDENYMLIEFPAHISNDAIEMAEKELAAVIHGPDKEFLVDMENTVTLYSSGVRLINFLHNEIRKVEGKLYIVNVSEQVEHLLKAVNLDKIIPIYRTRIDFEIGKDGVELGNL